MAKMSRYEKAINRLDYAYKQQHGEDPNAGFTGSGGGGRGNPYHVPAGGPTGGQFTHGPVGAVKNATEHVTTKGHGASDTRNNHKIKSTERTNAEAVVAKYQAMDASNLAKFGPGGNIRANERTRAEAIVARYNSMDKRAARFDAALTRVSKK